MTAVEFDALNVGAEVVVLASLIRVDRTSLEWGEAVAAAGEVVIGRVLRRGGLRVLETDIATVRPVPARRRAKRSDVVGVILVIGVLAALAVPSYLSRVQRADMQHVESSLARASMVAEVYYESHGTYVGLTDSATGLRVLDPDLTGVSAPVATGERYCLKGVKGRATAWVEGPGGTPTNEKPADCV